MGLRVVTFKWKDHNMTTLSAELWRERPYTRSYWGDIELVAHTPGTPRPTTMTSLCGKPVTKETHSSRGKGFRGWIGLLCPDCEAVVLEIDDQLHISDPAWNDFDNAVETLKRDLRSTFTWPTQQ